MRTSMKKLVSCGIGAMLSVSLVVPASAASNTASDSNIQSWQQKMNQFLKKQGWKGHFNWVVTLPSTPQPAPEAGTNTPAVDQPSNDQVEQDTSDKSTFASQVIELVNQERTKAGLKALTVHEKLSGMALDKAKDMSDNNYFSHTSPTYGSPFDMMKQYGISYRYAGENIAQGQRTPEEVMNSWMNSQGHRANILSENFTMIGVGYYNGYWVQEFISQ